MRKGPAVLAMIAAGATCAACGGGGGNGIGSKSPTAVLQTAVANLRAATSVTIVGDITQGSQSTAINGIFYSDGNFDGTVTIGGQLVKLIKIGGTDYINGPAPFWQSNSASASLATRLANRWISLPDSQGGIANSLSIDAMATSISQNQGTLKAGTTGTIDGQAAYSITSSKGGTLWVDSTGTAYPIELIGASGGNSGNLTFSAWNASSTPSAPTGAVPASDINGGSTTGTTGSTTSSTTGSGTTGTSSTTGSGTTGSSSTIGTSSTTGSGTTGTGSTTGVTG
jgi:hypothetical protein